MRHGTQSDIKTAEAFQRYVLNKEVFWFPQIIDGFDISGALRFPPLLDFVKKFIKGEAVVKLDLHMEGVDEKMLQQFLLLIGESKKEEKRQMDAQRDKARSRR